MNEYVISTQASDLVSQKRLLMAQRANLFDKFSSKQLDSAS